MTFPGLLVCLPPKIPLGPPPPGGGVGQICLGSTQSHIYTNMCAKFGCGPTVVSKRGRGHSHTHTYKGTLQLYNVVVYCFIHIYMPHMYI